MADGYLNFDTKINESGFNQGLSKLGSLAKSGVAAVGKTLVGVTTALTAGAAAGVKYNASIEQYQTSFEVMTGSAEKAEQVVQRLTKLGAETPFEMPQLAETTQLLMNYGFTADDAMDKMMMLGDISQGSADKMTRIATAYGQMSSAGKVQLEDIKQMIEAGFNPLQEISQTTGESMESLYDRISKGTISVDEITASMQRSTAEGGKYFQSMAKQSQTVSGQLSTLKDNAMQLLGSLTSGISEVLGGDILPAVNEMLGSLNDAFQTGGFQGFLDELGSAVPVLSGVTDAVGTLAEKLQGMSTEELASLGKTALTIGAAVPTILAFGSGIGTVKTAIQGFDGIINGVSGSISKVPTLVNGSKESISSLGKEFLNLGDAIALPFQDLGSKISPYMKHVTAAMAEMWTEGGGRLAKGALDTVQKIANGFGKLGPALSNKFPAITSRLSTVSTAFSSMGSKAAAALGNVGGKVATALGNVGSQISTYGSVIGEAFAPILQKAAGFAPQFLKYMNIAGGIGVVVAGLGLLYSAFGSEIDSLLLMVQTQGPQIISNLAQGITGALPNLIAQGATLIQNLMSAITANIPVLASAGVSILSTLVTGIAQQLPQLIPAALQMILTLALALAGNAGRLISAGLQLLTGLTQGIVNAVPVLISAIPNIIQSLATGIVQNLPTIILTGIQLLVSLAQGLISAIPQLLASIPEIFGAFIDGITSVDWLEVGKQILSAIVDGILSIGSSIVGAVKNIFTGGKDAAKEEGKKTGDGYAQGVSSTQTNVAASATNVANTATNSFANTMNANSIYASTAAMNLGNSANNGLLMSNVPGSFTANAQSAASGVTNTLNMNSINAMTAGMNVGNSANTGMQLSNMPGSFSAAGAQAGNGLATSINNSAASVTTAAGGVASAAGTAVSGANFVSVSASTGADAMTQFASAISGGAGEVSAAMSSVTQAAVSGLESAKLPQAAKTAGQKFYKSLSDGLKAGVGTIRNSANTLAKTAEQAVKGMGEDGRQAGREFSSGLANGITANRGSVASAAGSLQSSASAAVGSMSSLGSNAGAAFSSGLASGIRSGAGGVAAAAAAVASAAASAARANLQINSPSKVGEWLGKMYDAGVAKGLIGGIAHVVKGIDYMTDTLDSGAQNALRSLQAQAAMTTKGAGIRSSAVSAKYAKEQSGFSGLLDEWEKRQRKINNERDSRPVLLDGRQINRAKRWSGGAVTV